MRMSATQRHGGPGHRAASALHPGARCRADGAVRCGRAAVTALAPGLPRSRRGCSFPSGAAGDRVIETRRDGGESAAGGVV